MDVVVWGWVLILCLMPIYSNELDCRNILWTSHGEHCPARQLVVVEQFRWHFKNLTGRKVSSYINWCCMIIRERSMATILFRKRFLTTFSFSLPQPPLFAPTTFPWLGNFITCNNTIQVGENIFHELIKSPIIRKGSQRFWLHICECHCACAPSQMQNHYTETHLGGGGYCLSTSRYCLFWLS